MTIQLQRHQETQSQLIQPRTASGCHGSGSIAPLVASTKHAALRRLQVSLSASRCALLRYRQRRRSVRRWNGRCIGTIVMLRITNSRNAKSVTLRVEGRLEGPWVKVLADSWRSAVEATQNVKLRVDLNELTFIDAAGKAQLAEMYAQGAELLGDDLETKAIVAEIACK